MTKEWDHFDIMMRKLGIVISSNDQYCDDQNRPSVVSPRPLTQVRANVMDHDCILNSAVEFDPDH